MTKDINTRIRKLRENLHLSQEYVAKFLGISRTSYTQIENGNRCIKAEELAELCELFGVSPDFIMNGEDIGRPAVMFARSFEKLNEKDQAEIMGLIRFKEQMAAQRAGL